MTPEFVDTAAQLEQHISRWRSAEFLAIDTEFVREQTYYPQLCLIQISAGDTQVCIDPLAIPDLQALLDLLLDPGTSSVFHAASQDLEIFVRMAGRSPEPLFDTQIAASLLGYGDQLGYAGLVNKMCGVSLDKSLSRTNWARRPLTGNELAYAADDVRYLAEIYPRLRDELERRGRLQWQIEDCTAMAQPQRYQMRPELEYRRLKGLVRMPAKAQHVAARIAAWREVLAEQRDRPRRWILPDEAVYAMAERQPSSRAQLADLKVLPAKTVEKYGDTLVAVIAEAMEIDAPALFNEQRADDDAKLLLKRVLEQARAIAKELDIPPSLLAPRADIEALADQGEAADIALLRGWRREVAGDALLKLL